MVTEVDGTPFSPGKLVAWDPVANKQRWTINRKLPFNGGVLTTAGNLVFQGTAQGHLEAFSADTGKLVWSVATGSAISAAPVSYFHNDTQFVLIPIGSSGGCLQFVYPQMHATDESKGPTRLLAFSLEDSADLPSWTNVNRKPPAQPKLDASIESIELGRLLFSYDCRGCHGDHAEARFGGSVPDLRFSNTQTHDTWHEIVVGGEKQATGMPKFDLTKDESDAIRHYVLSRAAELRTGVE